MLLWRSGDEQKSSVLQHKWVDSKAFYPEKNDNYNDIDWNATHWCTLSVSIQYMAIEMNQMKKCHNVIKFVIVT